MQSPQLRNPVHPEAEHKSCLFFFTLYSTLAKSLTYLSGVMGYSQRYIKIGTSSYPCGELVQTDKCHNSGAKMASPSGANKASPCGASHAQIILRFFSVRTTTQREIYKPYSFFCCAPTISKVPSWLVKEFLYF